VIPAAEAGHATPRAAGVASEPPGAPRARIVTRPVAEARAEAARILARAREEAQLILARAESTTNDLIVQQQARARADALCLVVGEALELRKRQTELERHALDRSIGFATLLAERLLGEELAQSPERVRALARQALKEAAGARHAVLAAHPRDALELRSGLAGVATLLDSIEIEDDETLGRGQLRVETELGVIEADVRGQLERLAAQLKKLLESHAPEPG
jgi:flagellar biosynthesis/type III secretory pathway protein FliH